MRRDITEGKTGVALTMKMRLLDANNGCAPIANAAIYLWHNDLAGAYSGYNQPTGNTVGETFLRGIQVTDSNGEVTFTTIYPGWYPGRVTHLHFQVFLDNGTGGTATATSQIAFPDDVTAQVYATPLYPRGPNTSVPNVESDGIFRDGADHQIATTTGDVDSGLVAELDVRIAV
nr:hypothetical protein [uncultured bacterium]